MTDVNCWQLVEGIVVKVLNKAVSDGDYYKKKVTLIVSE